jgi:uncharacterized membrane protein YcaP (DUF421 family)
LGQIRLALVEVDGQLSIYCFDNEFVRPGLSVLPPEHRRSFPEIQAAGTYACNHCGSVEELDMKGIHLCSRCGKDLWSVALNTLRTG